MGTPHERLRRFMEHRELSSAGLAKLIGCSQPHAWRLVYGEEGDRPKQPRLEVLSAIERVTAGLDGGPIRVSDWLGTSPNMPSPTDEGEAAQ